ncbi:helix-turn-helix transcriptional regulator [Spirosoma utsteinense]|uniref:helix-turn-helix transcriptional regulator n=1 Tax=Spirosoma utsteinense TaxID=2585773 RepID=UPI0016461732|nr:AraC family transcriptional regulator [Spirosoma utsteinense]MBC3784177.1 AraC family transcriptional regulator [Spirosoma utsteinense]
MSLPAHVHQKHLLLIHQGALPVVANRQTGHRREVDQFRRGDVGLYPSGEYGPFSWDGSVDLIHVHLDAQELETRARRDLDLTHFALRERFRSEDGLLAQLGQQLIGTLSQASSLGHLYVESLANTLSYHLIEHHATWKRRLAQNPGARLSGAVLARIDNYLEASAEQLVSVERLAGLANLSVFHFARLFKQTTGYSPYQYVLKWKIQRAQSLLRTEELPVVLVSDVLGFTSPAHFSATFKRIVGVSPRVFQQG